MRYLLLAPLLLCLAIPAAANDTAMQGAGGAIQPMRQHSSVRMVSERVDVKLRGAARARVRCEFVFRNEGKTAVVKMGFPAYASGDVRPLDKSDLWNFRSLVDGKPVKTTFVKAKPVSKQVVPEYEAWYVKVVPFKAGQTRTVVDTYGGRLGESAYGAGAIGKSFLYILETGKNWKGTIGKAVITVDASNPPPGVRFKSASPKGYARRGNKFVWTLKDFEPVKDKDAIGIEYAPVNLPKRG